MWVSSVEFWKNRKLNPRMEHLSFEQGRPQEVICSNEKYQENGAVSTKKTFKSTSRSCSGKKLVGRVTCSKKVTQKSASRKWSSDSRCWTKEEASYRPRRTRIRSSMLNFSSVNDKMLRKEEIIEECKDAESESAKGKAARKAARRNADCAAAQRGS